jgi:hypothetical protein
MKRPQEITFGEMRESGVRGLLMGLICRDVPPAKIADNDFWTLPSGPRAVPALSGAARF